MVSPYGGMLYAIPKFRFFGIVEAIHRAHQVARDAPDALELHAFANVNFPVPLNAGKVRYYFRHCSVSWLLIRPGAPPSDDAPEGAFRYRISMHAFMKASACGTTMALP